MVCSRCAQNVADGSTVCPHCGAQLSTSVPAAGAAGAPPPPPAGTPPAQPGAGVPAGPSTPTAPPAPSGAGVPAHGAHRAAGSLPPFSFDAKRWTQAERITLVATVVLFVSLFLPWFGVNFGFGSVTVDGLWHGWMYITLILSLAVMLYLVARAGFSEMPFKLPATDEQVLLGATGVSAVLTLIAFLLKPGGSAVGWRFGAFVGLVAAIVAAAPLAIPQVQARRH